MLRRDGMTTRNIISWGPTQAVAARMCNQGGHASTIVQAPVGLDRPVDDDHLLALRPHGHDRYRPADELAQATDVSLSVRRQVFEPPGVAGVGIPAGKLLVHWDRAVEGRDARRRRIDALAVDRVAGADLDGRERVEHVEPGQGDGGDAVHDGAV